MKIGIFINYLPWEKISTEGLGRYLAAISKGFLENGNELTIAYPWWSENSLKELFDDFNICWEQITHVRTKKYPPLLYIYQKHKNKKNKRCNLNMLLKRYVSNQSEKITKCSSWLLFGTIIFQNIIIFLLSIPFIVGRYIYISIKHIIFRIINKSKRILKESLTDKYAYKFRRGIRENSANELVSIINSNNFVDVWYCPSLFWPEVTLINGPVVINLPDVVTQIYADEFAKITFVGETNDIRKTIKKGKYFISYSKYIKTEIIEKEYSGTDKNCVVINHIPNILDSYVKIDSSVSKKMNVEYDVTHKFCKNVLSQIQTFGGNLGRIDISNIHYIFYASQVRPHKNILTLIKAYEELIRKRFRHEKLILTGDISMCNEIREYVYNNQLSEEIIVCSGVSSQQLAALYYCSDLVVNPTLYEGGFPFTFCEGMSVGTPSLMSNIPVVTEIIDKNVYGEMLFNPYDYHELADRIEWALCNIEYLYEKELVLYKELIKRTNNIVSGEYEKTFHDFINDYYLKTQRR